MAWELDGVVGERAIAAERGHATERYAENANRQTQKTRESGKPMGTHHERKRRRAQQNMGANARERSEHDSGAGRTGAGRK